MKAKKSSKKAIKAPAKKKAALRKSRVGVYMALCRSNSDPVLARFEQGKSIAEFIDFSAGKFARL